MWEIWRGCRLQNQSFWKALARKKMWSQVLIVKKLYLGGSRLEFPAVLCFYIWVLERGGHSRQSDYNKGFSSPNLLSPFPSSKYGRAVPTHTGVSQVLYFPFSWVSVCSRDSSLPRLTLLSPPIVRPLLRIVKGGGEEKRTQGQSFPNPLFLAGVCIQAKERFTIILVHETIKEKKNYRTKAYVFEVSSCIS